MPTTYRHIKGDILYRTTPNKEEKRYIINIAKVFSVLHRVLHRVNQPMTSYIDPNNLLLSSYPELLAKSTEVFPKLTVTTDEVNI